MARRMAGCGSRPRRAPRRGGGVLVCWANTWGKASAVSTATISEAERMVNFVFIILTIQDQTLHQGEATRAKPHVLKTKVPGKCFNEKAGAIRTRNETAGHSGF